MANKKHVFLTNSVCTAIDRTNLTFVLGARLPAERLGKVEENPTWIRQVYKSDQKTSSPYFCVIGQRSCGALSRWWIIWPLPGSIRTGILRFPWYLQIDSLHENSLWISLVYNFGQVTIQICNNCCVWHRALLLSTLNFNKIKVAFFGNGDYA